MTVVVVCFGALRDLLPDGADGNRGMLDLPEGATAGDAVDALGAPRRLVFALLVDGRQASLDAPIHDGAEITLMPPFSGGSRQRR